MEGKFVLCENLNHLFPARLEVESLNLMKDKYILEFLILKVHPEWLF